MRIDELKLNFSDIRERLVIFFVLLMPFYLNHSKNFGNLTMRVTHEHFFELFAIFIFAFMIRNIWVAIGLIWTLFLHIFHDFTGGVYLRNIFSFAIIYFVAREIMTHELSRRVIRAIPILLAVQVWMMVLQIIRFDVLFNSDQGNRVEIVGFMGLKAISGMFIAMLIPFVHPVVGLLSLVLIAVTSESTGALLGGVAAFVFSLYHRSKRLFIAALVVLTIAAGAFAYKDSFAGMFTDRARLWKVVLKDAVTHPIVGFGLDSFRKVTDKKPFMYFKDVPTQETGKAIPTKDGFFGDAKVFTPDATADPWDNAHNEYVMNFMEFGILGLLIPFFLFRDLARRFRPTEASVAIGGYFIALLVMSIGQFPFHLVRIMFLFPVLLAIYEYETVFFTKE